MAKLRLLVGVLVFICSVASSAPTHASSSSVVVSQLQTGGAGSGTASLEFVELYNNASVAVNVSNWCVKYSSASDLTTTTLACLAPPDQQTELFIEPQGYVTLASTAYESATGKTWDYRFTATLSATSGHVRIFDASGAIVDTVGWKTGNSLPANPETEAVNGPVGGASITRIIDSEGHYQDTDSNATDFVQTLVVHHESGLYEQETVVDVCTNVDGVQEVVPARYTLEGGNCVVIPLPHLYITEILPNPSGDDTGSEFIELYNPNPDPVSLEHYRIRTGSVLDKQYAFPIGASIASGQYFIVTNTQVPFTLTNSGGRVQLADDFGTAIDETAAYANASDNWSWAYLGDSWQFTNQPTPGAANLPPIEAGQGSAGTAVATTLAPCGAGKYRNPLTNRCRNIEVDAAVLAACDSDEYRNPETNRCRKVAALASSLTPCDPGEERNPATNRCRSVTASSSELVACKEGQERNPETNRCRTIPTSNIPAANFAVQPIPDSPQAFVGWWTLAGIAVLALGYAGWEWRHELRDVMRKIRTHLRPNN